MIKFLSSAYDLSEQNAITLKRGILSVLVVGSARFSVALLERSFRELSL